MACLTAVQFSSNSLKINLGRRELRLVPNERYGCLVCELNKTNKNEIWERGLIARRDMRIVHFDKKESDFEC